MQFYRRGFTLIELLIVVAIIAILAAIAVPNFLEAQTRAKVSRNMADFRTATTALETYRVDHNMYPYDGFLHIGQSGTYHDEYPNNRLAKNLTTPISYLSNCYVRDPFAKMNQTNDWQSGAVKYWNTEATFGTKFDKIEKGAAQGYHQGEVKYREWKVEFGEFILFALGPDGVDPASGTPNWQHHRDWKGVSNLPMYSLWTPYDATNGTISNGNIMWSQKSAKGYINAL